MGKLIIKHHHQPETSPTGAGQGFRQIMARGGATTVWLPRAVELTEDGEVKLSSGPVSVRSHIDLLQIVDLFFKAA